MHSGVIRSRWRAVKFTMAPIDDYINALQEKGTPKDIQWLIRELFTVVLDGRKSHVMSGVEEALKRPATDFKSYFQKTKPSGVWSTDIEGMLV